MGLHCDPNRGDAKGMTPVHHAAIGGRVEVLKTLLAASGDLDAKCPPDSSDEQKRGCTPAHLAAMKDRVDVLTLLADRGADFTVHNTAGQTPKDLAVSDAARSVLI